MNNILRAFIATTPSLPVGRKSMPMVFFAQWPFATIRWPLKAPECCLLHSSVLRSSTILVRWHFARFSEAQRLERTIDLLFGLKAEQKAQD